MLILRKKINKGREFTKSWRRCSNGGFVVEFVKLVPCITTRPEKSSSVSVKRHSLDGGSQTGQAVSCSKIRSALSQDVQSLDCGKNSLCRVELSRTVRCLERCSVQHGRHLFLETDFLVQRNIINVHPDMSSFECKDRENILVRVSKDTLLVVDI